MKDKQRKDLEEIRDRFSSKSKLEDIVKTVDFNDFQTKACLMALGSSLVSNDLGRFIADLEKVTPELREAITIATKLLYGFTTALLERIDPAWCEAEEAGEEWPDLLETARRELSEDGNL